MNRECDQFVASYEPLVNDVSVSIKHLDHGPLPNDGAVYPRWTLNDHHTWSTVSYSEAMRLVPTAAIRTQTRIDTFRVFATGSVVQVGRWPCSMHRAFSSFVSYMTRVRKQVLDVEAARQRTLDPFLTRRRGVS